ncbi:MAG: aminoglycoside phosphotransferase family protein [Candidatus Sericytochromatia bacterium]
MTVPESERAQTSPPADKPGGLFRDRFKIQTFLQEILKQPVSELEILPAGWNTRVVAFQKGQDALVLRLSKYAQSTAKERMAHTFFAPDLPVPPVWCEGTHGPLYWAIVSRCPGQDLGKSTLAAQLQYAPQIMAVLRQLIEQALPRNRPAAWTISLNEADWPSRRDWKEALFALHGMRKRLEDMAHPSAWLTPEKHRRLVAAFETGLEACPSTPLWWIHGDFKAANLLAHKGQITGVIDWAGLGYGDFLYDAALWLWHQPHETWLVWWPWFHRLYRDLGLDLSAAEIRLQTYLLHTGLGTLVALVSVPALHPSLPFYERQLEAILAGELQKILSSAP